MGAGRGGRRAAGLSTAALLQCAAIAAASAILMVALAPVLFATALASPVLYSLVGSFHILGPLIAGRWLRRPGVILVTAFVASVLATPFTALGLLVIPALCIPAATVEIVLGLGRFWRTGSRLVWFGGAAAGGVAIFAISLAVIDPRVLSGAVVALTLAGRVLAYLALGAVAVLAERALARAGVSRLRPSRRNETDEAG
ncbi:hypothetical protein [Herbiconiux ginsengi]|uniref:Energy-coupling factor transport system substrate-specific component n=1 Tax=Herbiconiux ginsengi TaxID=381665 RepID=A0A1H3LSW9_9MICO|nr:hypothetical protein [Herbiconiux ginsengi]SDY67420.1 hypothetical protein SAMN05216554_1116 [Herbiconiux ginsengi]